MLGLLGPIDVELVLLVALWTAAFRGRIHERLAAHNFALLRLDDIDRVLRIPRHGDELAAWPE